MEKLKKILIGIVAFFSLLFCVNAENNKGMLYEVYWQSSGVNVFAKDTLTGAMDYNGWMIVSSYDDKVYYCIEPELEMYNSSNAINGAYTIYRGEDISSNSRLTKEMAERVKLLAYYGYKYKGHTDKKWYGITQVMIWQTVIKNASGNYKNTTWSFKDSRYGNVNDNLYKNEVAELEKLVSNHRKKPSFDNTLVSLNIGQTITIKDDNKAISNFVLSKSNLVDINENGDELIITGKNIGRDTINLTNDIGLRTSYELYTSSMQDVISRGEVTYINSKFDVEVLGGVVTLFKKDKDSKTTEAQGDATLLNSKYNIYDMEDNLVKEIVIDKQGKEVSLPFGDYKIKEEIPPLGYTKSDKEYEFSLSKENDKISLDLYDLVIKGTHVINKSKGGAGEEFTSEVGAVFKVVNMKGEEVGKIKTFKRGVGTINLPYGKYKIIQEIGAEYYAYVEEYEINIDQDGIEIEVDLNNIKYSKLVFTKTDYSTNEALPDTLIEIYKEDDTLIYRGKTDKDGKIELPNLEIGKYYILEKEAPKYYKINEEKMYFEVLKHGEIIKCNMQDEKIKGNFKLIKKDSSTKNVLEGVEFSIYTSSDKLVYKGKTNKDGEIILTNIDGGKYYIIENKAVDGYNINKGKTYFEVLNDSLVEVTLYNDKIVNPSTKDIIITYFILFIISSFTLSTVYAVKRKVKQN